LHEWLLGREHATWERWSEVGVTLGQGGARVYLNDLLMESLIAERPEHPLGAAAVRELYAEDFTTLTGYSALVKANSEEGNGWFCFEVLEPGPDVEATTAKVAAPGCQGCHRAGHDFIQSRLPLP
jgi:hypothetical protein